MRGLRRHPSRVQLETWFDGESAEGSLAWHLATCTSCFRYVDELSRIRAAVRRELRGAAAAGAEAAVGAGAFEETGDDLRALLPAVPPSAARAPRRRALALAAVPVVVLLVAGLVIGVDRAGVRGTLSSALGAATSSTAGTTGRTSGDGTGTSGSTGSGRSATGGSPAGTTAGGTTARSGNGGATGGRGTGPLVGLRLAVVVPTQGAGAADGTEITQAAQKAVAEADAAGGVNGGQVTLTVVPAENTGAVAALAGSVDAVIGGFGAALPAGLQWFLPADPWAAGPGIVSSELSPEAAGARLGQDLLQRGVSGTVGVVQGTGQDAALATGLASVVPTTVVAAPVGGTCVPAVTALQAQGVAAVAVAGSPALASSCVAALAAGPWSPPGGILLAPSAAYAGVASTGVGPPSGVFTVLGLPWPTSSDPGAQRFRSDFPGFTSYRALVSYAAVEMAVEVARTTGAVSTAGMPGRTWRNDLYDFSGTANAGAAVVEEAAGGWVNAP